MCELAIPYCTSKTLFAVAKGLPPDAFRAHLEMLAAAALGFAVFAALRGWLFGVLNNRFVCNLRSRLFSVLMREETSFHGGRARPRLRRRRAARRGPAVA
jgi:hypothetical protein